MPGTNDDNYLSYANEKGVRVTDRTITPPAGKDDILKFSNCEDVVVSGCVITGGEEDCFDAVRGKNYTVKNSTLKPKGKGGMTIKGAIEEFVIENVEFDGHGKEYDIELGMFDNYWKLFRKPTRRVFIRNVRATDSKPVLIRVWDATDPIVVGGRVKIKKYHPIIWLPYFLLRYIQIRLKK